MRRLICAAALIFIACALNASALSSGSYGDIDITIDNPVGDEISHGYASYGVQVQNRSPNKTRRVKIRIEPEGKPMAYHEEGRLKSLSKTIEVAPNAAVHTHIRQPFLTLNSWHLKASVWIDGQKQTEPLPLPGFARRVFYLYNPKTPDFRISDSDPVVAMDSVQKMRLPSNAGAGSVGTMRRRDLETNGLIYGSLDGILLTLEEAEALSGAEREALWEYVKNGGSLAVMGDGKLPDEWQSLDARLENPIPKSGLPARYEIGFGQLFLAQPPPHKGSVRYSLYDSWKKTQHPWNATYTPSGANAVLPVAEPYDPLASYRRMFFLMLFLAVLIGPVNIYLFRKIDRRMKLYWTVPAASLLACVLVVFYAAIGDEGKRMRICSLTYLDQGARSASTIGWVGYYSPSAHPDGLLFDEETELTIQSSSGGIIKASGSGGIMVSGINLQPGVNIIMSGINYNSFKPQGRIRSTGSALTIGPSPTPAPSATSPPDSFSATITFSEPVSGPPPTPTISGAYTVTPWAPTSVPPSKSAAGATSTASSWTVIVQPVGTDDHPVGSIDWTDGQRWSGEWIKPRIPAAFQIPQNTGTKRTH